MLVPTLKPGDIAIIDTWATTKGSPFAVLSAQALLPHYSPDLNPIEQVFAKLNSSA